MTLPEPRPTPPRGYLDAVAGQPLLPVAAHALQAAAAASWADPARLHHEGRRAGLLLDTARAAIAAFLGVRTQDVFFASSAPVAAQVAIWGLVHGRRGVSDRIVVSAVESMAVLGAAATCPDTVVATVPVDGSGRVDVPAFIDALADGAALACLQLANAEVGTLQPIDEVSSAAHAVGVPLLVDATQAICHVELPHGWDVLVGSARDWGGPSGVGILVVRPSVRWVPEQTPDRGWVGGFPDIASAASAATALEYLQAAWSSEAERHREMIEHLRTELPNRVAGIHVAGDPVHRLPHIVTFTCDNVAGEALVTELDRAGIAVASGSACTADNRMPSHVLAAMGMAHDASVRVSLPFGCEQESIDAFLDAVPAAVERVREQFSTS